MSRPLHPNEYIKDYAYDSFDGMKITFINMPLRETALPNVPPEGPGILAAIARRYGAEPYIIDLNGYRIKDKLAEKRGLPNGRHMTYAEAEAMIVQHLNNVGDQDVIAFSGKITTLRWQEEVAKIVKKHQPDCFLVTGNGLATEIKTGLFKWIPELDAIGRSEGDDIILLILNDAMAIKQYGYKNALNSDKLSPFYLGEIDGKPRFRYEGNRPKNLDDLPSSALDLLESDPYGHNVLEDYINVPVWGLGANNSSATPFTMKRSLTTVSSRGCPYACAFCYRGSQGERNYGMRAVEDIATQVRGYVDKYNLDFIGFPDDNFAVSKRRIAKFPEVFKEYGLESMRWGTHTRMDEADARIFDMAKSGCVYIGFGAESASEHTLTVMKKGGFILRNGMVTKNVNGNNYEFPKTMVDAIVNCKDANIHPNCTWIMAYPGEDLQHLQTSVAFILWQREFWTKGLTPGTAAYNNAFAAVNSKMFTATAYPGTEMWNVVKPQLQKHFDISFDFLGNPICDDNFHSYVLELDDATKVLNDKNGNPVNFGEMPMDTFLQAREYIDSDKIEKVLEL
tara:strand:- start:10392 stop:12086 length:1695 start_codon:yes stop_codon:yes gene_type:complete